MPPTSASRVPRHLGLQSARIARSADGLGDTRAPTVPRLHAAPRRGSATPGK
jgi:hypothetical protein